MNGIDACNWYWINIVVDCTVGVGIEYLLLQGMINHVLPTILSPESLEDFTTGDYGDPSNPDLGRYGKQLGLWCTVVFCMKVVMVIVMLVGSAVFAPLSAFILSPFEDSPDVKLVVVMIFTPAVMNALQLWITDNFLKKHDDKEAQVDLRQADLRAAEMEQVNPMGR